MDRFDREQNESLMNRGIAALESARTFSDAIFARAMIARAAEAEVRRLKEKERLMKAGLIRTR